MKLLILKNIVKDYVTGDTRVRALDDVTVAFRRSELVSVLGHSGCGKTTLLNIVGGLDHYTDGDISIKGISTKNYKDADWDTYRNHSIGFVFQSYNLIPHQTVLSNVELALTISGASKAERKKRAAEALIKVGLGDQLHKKPNQMSGGQMQRVAIARALVNDPEILLADEPTGALDTETSVQIMDILREISKDRLIIMVTHNPELADKYSDRIIRLSDGRIVGDSAPYEISDAEADTEALLKAEAEKEAAFAADAEQGTGGKSQKAAKKKKQKRPSMSFLTAISLSFNNLLTKKTRTFLTSFAGSIGIIGIALILSLSNGINAFIARVQKETLSSYPITLQREQMDVSSLITSFMGENQKPENADPDKIYSNNVSYNLLNTMTNPSTSTNNLDKFKTFLDKENNAIKEHASLIRYGYNADINAYLKNADGSYYKADINELFVDMAVNMGISSTNASSMMSSSFSSFNIWQEMLPPSDSEGGELMHGMIKEQYDLISGKWPESKEEILLLVSADNRITDLSLYSLGLTSKDEMLDAVMKAISGTPVDSEIKEYAYNDLVGISYKVIPTSDYYYKNSSGEWLDYRDGDNSLELNGIIAGGLDLKISGIIRQKPEATAGSLSGTLIYTSALTDYLVERVAESDIVKAQNATPTVDIFTGLPFNAPEESRVPEADKPAAFRSYMDTATKAKKAEIYKLILTTPDENAVKAQTAATLSMMGVTPETSREDLLKIVMEYAVPSDGGELSDEEKKAQEALIKQYFENLPFEQLYGYIYSFALNSVRDGMTDSAQKYVDEIVNAPNDVQLDAEKTKILFKIIYGNDKDTFRLLAEALASGDTGFEQLQLDGKSNEEVYSMLMSAMDAYSRSYESKSFYTSMTGLPAVQLIIDEEKKAYIVNHYLEVTSLTSDDINVLLSGKSDSEINGLFESIVDERAKEAYKTEKAVSQSEYGKSKKLADAFDEALASGIYTDSQLTAFYDEYVPQESSSTLAENLALFGSHDKSSPDYISIYPVSFEDKQVISDIIEQYNSEQTDENDKITYTDYVGLIMSSVTSIIDAVSYVLIFFVSISLVVSSIMIGIITYISVLERAKEIGILRAMGASKRDVANVFNAETLIVGFASGMIGIIVTLLLNIPIGLIIKHFSGISGIASLPVLGAIILVVISMSLTLISGLIPSRIAARKDPVEALRSE